MTRKTFARATLLFALLAPAVLAMPPDLPQDRFIKVYGATIRYWDVGSGPAVVLIHGLADDVTIWEKVVSPLAARHRVLVLDQIGFGRSDKPPFDYRVGTFVDFLERFLRELRVERTSLVGNSLGGWVAASFAIAHPTIVDRLILVGAVGYASLEKEMPVSLDDMEFSTKQQIRKLLPFVFADRSMTEGAGAEEITDALLTQRVVNGDGYTISRFLDSVRRKEDVLDGRVGSIKAPTLVVWGLQDLLVPIRIGERFARDIPGARLYRIEGCGHMPQFECPDRLTPELLRFLNASRP